MKINKKHKLLSAAVWFCWLFIWVSLLVVFYNFINLFGLSLANTNMDFDSFRVNIFVVIVIVFDIARLITSIFVFESFSKQGCRKSLNNKVVDIAKFKNGIDFKKDDLRTPGGMQNFIIGTSFGSIIRLMIDIGLAYFLIWGSFN